MDHTNLILTITLIACFSGVGIFVLIKKISQFTPTPQNVLTRRGDIELANYNEPTQPLATYYPNAWLREVSSGPPSYNGESINKNVIAFIPSHHPEFFYINSILENEYSLIIFVFLVFILISLILIVLIIQSYKKNQNLNRLPPFLIKIDNECD